MLSIKKTPYTSLKKFNEGKELTTEYFIEHTNHDPEIEEINFSNIVKETFEDLEKTMEWLNRFQQQGYKNISLGYTVYNKERKYILEDYINNIDITFNSKVTNEIDRRNSKLNEVIDKQDQQIKLYESFLEKYKSTKLFDEYEKDVKLNWYEYRLRGFSIGCQPKGFIKHNDKVGKHGIVAYDRILTDDELNEYELNCHVFS